MPDKPDIPDNLRESPFGGLCCKGCGKLLTIAMAEDHKCPPKPSKQKVGVSKREFWG